MARPRYPSDDRRRQRPHVKVHLSWPTHPHYAHAYADLQTRAIVVGIWLEAARAHAARTSDRVTLTGGLACSVTGASRLRDARVRLASACLAMGYELAWSERGDRVRAASATITLRNFAKKQGFTPRTPRGVNAELRVAPSASEEPKNRGVGVGTPTPTEEPSTGERTPRKPRSAPVRRTTAPEVLPPVDQARVLAWAADVLPRVRPEEIEARIEQALGYYRREGQSFVAWADAVIGNITALENRERKRNGDPPVRSRAEARRLTRAIAAERAAMDREAAEAATPPLPPARGAT